MALCCKKANPEYTPKHDSLPSKLYNCSNDASYTNYHERYIETVQDYTHYSPQYLWVISYLECIQKKSR